MNSFVEMRRFLLSNKEMFARLDRVELKQLQIYDAFSFIVELIQKAKKEIILIDNYVDVHTLNILCKKNKGVDVVIVTAGKGKL